MKDWLEPNYHKVLGILIAIICLFVGVKNILKANGFKDSFPAPNERISERMPLDNREALGFAGQLLVKKTEWTEAPVEVSGGLTKTVPLFVSVRIVEHDNQLIDMTDPSAILIRPPVPNKWLTDNGLQYLSATVLEQDPDVDGYDNLEEYEANTSPVDPSSHPPYTDKLVFLSLQKKFHRITFKADNDPAYAIREESRKIGRKDGFYKIGDTLASGRFKVEAYEKKMDKDAIGTPVPASELTMLDLNTGEKFVIILKKEDDRPELFGEFDFLLDTRPSFFVKEGQSERIFQGMPNPEPFSLGESDTIVYQLVTVTDNEAVIASKDNLGQTITISKGSVPTEGEEGAFADDPSN
ncbi:MAG: hypothetical protein ACI8UO_004845 [Verrucomicrobiales bacterium]